LAQLLGPAQNDLVPSVVILNCAFDFELTAFKLSSVAHLLEIGGKDNHRKGARFRIFAKVEELGAVLAVSHMRHGSRDALGCAHMLARLGK
jgi:hypothetical protein